MIREYFFCALLLTSYVAVPILTLCAFELLDTYSPGFRRFARWLWKKLDM